jgi:signal transduction histidine kinase
VEKEEQLALANALSQLAISNSDLNDLCEGFGAELRHLLSIDWAAIALIDDSTGALRFSPLSAKIRSSWELGDSIPLKGTPVAWLAVNQSALLEPDLKRENRFRTGIALVREGIRSAVYMPLFARKEIFGALLVGSRKPDVYGDRDLKLLRYAVTQLATAIENSRLFQESRKRTELQADFITALAHELKTPLTPIRASSQLLAEEFQQSVESPHARLADNIFQSADTLDRKLSGMLELARVQSASFKLELESVDVVPLIEEMVERVRPEIRQNGQVLDLRLPESLPPVKANREKLGRVLLNLLTNATRFSPFEGELGVRVENRGSEIWIEIQDSGTGFSPQELDSLFDVYHASGADRQRIPEMKLGLALSKRLMELQKGRLWVQSTAGKGNTFGLSLRID